jgi:DNA-binding NarL/FixJ family response regulator
MSLSEIEKLPVNPQQVKSMEHAEKVIRALLKLIELDQIETQLPKFQFSTETHYDLILSLEIDGTSYFLTKSEPKINKTINLSPREMAISQLISEGYSNKIIANILEISCWTVATHIRRIFEKLNVTTRAAMVARISQENLW